MQQLTISFSLIGTVLGLSRGWGYEVRDGPDTWGGLCQLGRSQSPIDIHAADVEYAPLHRIHFVHYDNRNFIELFNNGHTILASGFQKWAAKQPYVTSGGLKHKYKLEQFHIHWAEDDYHGSEHTLGGLSYPAELHLVHHREDLTFAKAIDTGGGLAVVAVFLTIGEESKPLEHIVGSLNEVIYPGNRSEIQGFHLRRLLPHQHDSYYRYDGSLTTPGCNESVVWTVLTEPISITRRQMDELRRVQSQDQRPYHFNSRPTQPINGRKILYRPAHFDKSMFCSSTNGLVSSLVIVASLFAMTIF